MADKKYTLTFAMSDGTEKSVQFTVPEGPQGPQGIQGEAANAITFVSQYLTEEQKKQARQNIGIDDVLKPLEIIGNALGEVIALKDSSAYELQGLILYGKTTQNGTPTPDAPVELESVGNGGSVSVNVIGENNEQQTVTISTPDGLRGIPLVGYDVHLYSGNHTDAAGQQWVCDEIDFVRGVHVQRVSDAINPILGSINRNNPEHDWVSVYTGYSDRIPHSRVISASLQSKSFDDIEPNASLGSDAVLWYANSSWGIAIRRSVLGIDADMGESEIVSLVNAWVAEKGITVHYCLATPVETALTDHTKLHTYKPNTTITNDGGAEMAVEYVADTKTYIDNKFAELATAIVNNT